MFKRKSQDSKDNEYESVQHQSISNNRQVVSQGTNRRSVSMSNGLPLQQQNQNIGTNRINNGGNVALHKKNMSKKSLLSDKQKQIANFNSRDIKNNRLRDFKIYKDAPDPQHIHINNNNFNSLYDNWGTTLAHQPYQDPYSANQTVIMPSLIGRDGFFNPNQTFIQNENKNMNESVFGNTPQLKVSVLFDHNKMFRIEQAKRLDQMLKDGTKKLSDLKIRKHQVLQSTDMKSEVFRNQDRLQTFYQDKRINSNEPNHRVNEVRHGSAGRGSQRNSIEFKSVIKGGDILNPSQRKRIYEFQGAVFESEGNINDEILVLKKKFEENEAKVIHDLYTTHFQQKGTITPTPDILENQEIQAYVSNKQTKTIEVSSKLTSGVENSQMFDQKMQSMPDEFPISPKSMVHFEKVKYVQYIPKNKIGEQELNGLDVYGQKNNQNELNQTQKLKQQIENLTQKCHLTHVHGKHCPKNKEFDLAILESEAFKQLVPDPYSSWNDYQLQNAANPNAYKPSFFPPCSMPDEIQNIIKETKEFQKNVLSNDKLLDARPRTTQNAQSRFFSRQGKRNGQVQSMNQSIVNSNQQRNTSQGMNRSDLLMQRRQHLRQKTQIRGSNFYEETYDSNKFDPEFINQQLNSFPKSHFRNMTANTTTNRGYYYPKVSILNYAQQQSQDSIIGNIQNNNPISQWDDHTPSPNSQNIILSKSGNPNNLYFTYKVSDSDDQLIKFNHEMVAIPSGQQSSNLAQPNNNNNTLQTIPQNQSNQFMKIYSHNNDTSGSLTPSKNNELQNYMMKMEKPKNQFFNFSQINKLRQQKWQSPYEHNKQLSVNKKNNLHYNECQNFEKSFKVSHALSLNTSMNNTHSMWVRNQNKQSNYQTRQKLQNQTKRSQSRGAGVDTPIQAHRISYQKRPSTQPLQFRKKSAGQQKAMAINTVTVDESEHYQMAQKNIHMENESFLSMSSHLNHTHHSIRNYEMRQEKRMIMSKRSENSPKDSRSPSDNRKREMGASTLAAQSMNQDNFD